MEQTSQGVPHNIDDPCKTSMLLPGVAEASHGLVRNQRRLPLKANANANSHKPNLLDEPTRAQVQLQNSSVGPAATPEHQTSAAARAESAHKRSRSPQITTTSLQAAAVTAPDLDASATICVEPQPVNDCIATTDLRQTQPSKRLKTADSQPAEVAEGGTEVSSIPAKAVVHVSAASALDDPAAEVQVEDASPFLPGQQQQQLQQATAGSRLCASGVAHAAVAANRDQRELQDWQINELQEVRNHSSSPDIEPAGTVSLCKDQQRQQQLLQQCIEGAGLSVSVSPMEQRWSSQQQQQQQPQEQPHITSSVAVTRRSNVEAYCKPLLQQQQQQPEGSSAATEAVTGQDVAAQRVGIKRQRSSSINSNDAQQPSKQLTGGQVRRSQPRAATAAAASAGCTAAAAGPCAASAAAAAAGPRAVGTSYRGIIRRRNGRYDGRLTVLGVKLYLGVFDNPADAAAAYDIAALALYDETAATNFPRSNYSTAAVAARRAELLDKLKNHQNNGGSQAGQQARQWAASQLEKDRRSSSTVQNQQQQQQQRRHSSLDRPQQQQQDWEPLLDIKKYTPYPHGRTQAVGRARAAAVAAAARASKGLPSAKAANLPKRLAMKDKCWMLQSMAASKKPRLAAAVASATSQLQRQGSSNSSGKIHSKCQQQQQQQQLSGVYAARRSTPGSSAAAAAAAAGVSGDLLETIWSEYAVHPRVLDSLLCLLNAATCVSPTKPAQVTAATTAAADTDTLVKADPQHQQQQQQQQHQGLQGGCAAMFQPFSSPVQLQKGRQQQQQEQEQQDCYQYLAASSDDALQSEELEVSASPAASPPMTTAEDLGHGSRASIFPVAAAKPPTSLTASHHHKLRLGHSSGTKRSHSNSTTPALAETAAAAAAAADSLAEAFSSGTGDASMLTQQQPFLSRNGRNPSGQFTKAAADSQSAAAAAAARVIGFAAALVSPSKGKSRANLYKPVVSKTADRGSSVPAAASTVLVESSVGGGVKTFGPGCVSHAQNPTGHMGVRSRKGRFEAFVATPPFRYLYVGQYDSVEEAAAARDSAMLALYGGAAAAYGSAWLSPGAAAAARVPGSSAAAAVMEMAKKLIKKDQVLSVMKDHGTEQLLQGACHLLQKQQHKAQVAAASTQGAGATVVDAAAALHSADQVPVFA